MKYTSGSREATYEIGKGLGEKAAPGSIFALAGDLGAGKTVFAKGFAEGVGVKETVTSPTFTIMQLYESGRIPLAHFDVYRIEDPDELDEIGFDEYIGGDGVTLIEWHERAEDLIPETALEVLLSPQEDGSRIITLIPHGRWEAEHR